MTWVMIDDGFPEHPKFLSIGDDGLALWARALAYANKWLTDGFIPREAVPRLSRSKKPFDVAKKLVDARSPGSEHGLWEEVDGGYRFHDFHDYQPSAAAVRSKRTEVSAQRSAAGRKGAAQRWQTDSKEDGKPKAETISGEKQQHGPSPDPIPDPGSLPERSAGSGTSEPQALLRGPAGLKSAAELILEALRASRVLAELATKRYADELATHTNVEGNTGRLAVEDVIHAITRADALEASGRAGNESPRRSAVLRSWVTGCVLRQRKGEARAIDDHSLRSRRGPPAPDVQHSKNAVDRIRAESDANMTAHAERRAREEQELQRLNAERRATGQEELEEVPWG